MEMSFYHELSLSCLYIDCNVSKLLWHMCKQTSFIKYQCLKMTKLHGDYPIITFSQIKGITMAFLELRWFASF